MLYRVRFAPSPTGYLHVGSAHTALFNYLFAHQNKGRFILRIEDTDKTRSTEEAIEEIMDSLKWLGIDWDEGPDIGSDYGPYRQTERLETYLGAAEDLLEKGQAYLCFCQPQDLEKRRQQQLGAGKTPTYPKTCRDLTKDQISSCQAQGVKPNIRLAAPLEGNTVVNDLIKGPVTFENANIDDYVLIRSNGTATYNMAVVIDDHTMDITHVIRGDDHLSNTPRQIALYQALGYNVPQFAHLPLIAGKDNKPLSKRHGSVSVKEFKNQGYLPQALINYLALLGWGYDEKTTIFSKDELMEKFSLQKVSKNAAIWDPDKLQWMNGEYIRKLPNTELAEKLQVLLKKDGINEKNLAKLEKMAGIVKERIRTLNEALTLITFFYKRIELDRKAKELIAKTPNSTGLLKGAYQRLEQLANFDHEEIEHSLRELAAELDIKPSILFQLIRVAISGSTISPPLFESLEILGKEESLDRIKEIIQQ